MKGAVAIAKKTDAKKGFPPTMIHKSVHRVWNEHEGQLGSLGAVIGNIRNNGGTPSAENIASELSSMHTTQRAPVLLGLQQTHGNRYVQRVVSGIQAKLAVGQSGDKYEQEADRVADAVTRERGLSYEIADSDNSAFIGGLRAGTIVDGECIYLF